MKADYQDIRRAIPSEPLWFDENGTPRYCAYHPSNSPNIYIESAALVEIQCQDCGEHFQVEVTDPIKNPVEYGDPPAHDCVGDTMCSELVRVVEFWSRNVATEWIIR